MKTTTKGGGGGAQNERRTEAKTKTKKKGDGSDEQQTVVLRMELHCDGCALKVRNAIKGAQGAERVRTDVAAGTVTVAGNADPWDLRDRIMARIRPAVDIAFVSPANPPRQQQERRRISKNKQLPPPPPESTVVLSIQLHCRGCTDRIKHKATKIKGVKQVTVRGTMDAKALPDVLSAKLKRPVTAVMLRAPPMANNKDKKAAAAADGCGQNHGDNREKGEEEAAGGGGAKKKNKNWKQQRGGAAAAVAGDDHDDEMFLDVGGAAAPDDDIPGVLRKWRISRVVVQRRVAAGPAAVQR